MALMWENKEYEAMWTVLAIWHSSSGDKKLNCPIGLWIKWPMLRQHLSFYSNKYLYIYTYILTDHTYTKSPLAKLWLTTKQRHKQIQRRARSRMHIYVIRPRHKQHFNLLYRIRKSKDYVYGIWVHKVLGIWKCYYRVKKSLVSCMKPWTEARNNNKYMKSHCKLIYQLILKCEPKSGISCRRQVVHPRPQNAARRISC